MKTIIKRMRQPTPSFFRKIRNIGLTMATVGGSVLAAPVALPAAIVTVAGYLAVAGTVASAVSQAVTKPVDGELGNTNTKSSNRKKKTIIP